MSLTTDGQGRNGAQDDGTGDAPIRRVNDAADHAPINAPRSWPGQSPATDPAVVGRETLLTTPWLTVASKLMRGMPGSTGDDAYIVVRPRDYVSVIAVTTDDTLLLVRQYRPAVERYTLELPSGLVDAGESTEDTARRELLEETGYRAGDLHDLGSLVPDTGRSENTLWCYVALGVEPALDAGPPEVGMEVLRVQLSDLLMLLRAPDFDHALHLAVILRAIAHGYLPLPRA